MAYLAPIHQPSSVRHALKLHFLDPTDECLIVAKANRLEVYTQTQDGLSLKHTKVVYGKVTMLCKLQQPGSTADHLFVGTDRQMYFTISWNADSKQIRTERTYVDQADKSARDLQTGERCLLDPTQRFLTLELYEGVVTVVPITTKQRRKDDPPEGSLGEPIPIRISELFVRSSTFFSTRVVDKQNRPQLGLLYEDTQKRVRLQIYELVYSPGLNSTDTGSVELETRDGLRDELELGASHLIPVAAPAHGVLILGETSITYFEHSSHDRIRRDLEEATIFVAWSAIDEQRFVLGDEYGKLYLLMIDLDGRGRVQGWKLDVIGETSRASVLVYLGDGNVFVGSHSGNSQVVAIRPQSIDVVQTFANIAPILDFTIMDMGNRTGGETAGNEFSSGQARLVTGSGAFRDGSLRSVRSGVGLEYLGLLGNVENVIDMFSLRTTNRNNESSTVDTLLVSFVDETRAFYFHDDGDVEELEDVKGVRLDEGTLLAKSVNGNKVLQVTNSTARLTDADSGMIVAEWTPPQSQTITAVSANDNVVIICVGGSTLCTLDMTRDLQVQTRRSFSADEQIACVTIAIKDTPFCAVGFWRSSAVAVLHMDSLETACSETVEKDGIVVARSVLIANVLTDQNPLLFVAMADGNVFTFHLDLATGALFGKKGIVLGTQQASFRALPRDDGLYNVLAICEHPSLIYGSEGRLVYSAITAEDASCVCPFDSVAYPGAIAIATKDALKIALVDEERSTHVQGLAVHETVRRIAYSAELKAFGLGTVARTLEQGAEVVRSSFKLVDEILFGVLATYELNAEELVESVMRARLSDGVGGMAERFVIGTAYLDDEATDAVRGRILVLEVTEDRSVKLVAEHAVKGACRCLAMLDGHIVAALIKTVVVYGLEYETASTPFFSKKASYRTATAPIDVAVESNTIAIADLMKSVSVVEYTKGKRSEPDTLTEVARHFQTTWGTAVALVEEGTFLESDAEGNLMVLSRNSKGLTSEDRRRLQVTAEMQLGEMVNRIRPIKVMTSPDAVVVPRAFLATVEGSIYLFATISKSKQDQLMRLQASMASLVRSPGEVPFNKFRAFRNQVREAEEPFRFVDGELVEQFLDCEAALQERIVEGVGMDVEEVRTMVEGLRRLR